MDAGFQKILSILPESTKMVIFPAHNENENAPYNSLSLHPEVGLADWKGFLDQLIIDGVEKYMLCYNDEYGHSKQLAGFAGACLIYSYLYQKPATFHQRLGYILYPSETQDNIENNLKEFEFISESAYNFSYN
ncbi:MAG TPA: hypothetical protein PLD48_04805 [Bacillota bacterium]|nr:hypothetical protein [Bacillota bacterium]HOK68192.1 hypothetical protein [Bacillota bacterium]HPP84991.1 hypothetical protein [Bacillota bacterium]